MSKGIDRITDLVSTANDTLIEGVKVGENAEKAWADIKLVFDDSLNLVNTTKAKYEEFEKKFGSGDIGTTLLAVGEAKTAIDEIIAEVESIKTKVLGIYEPAKEMKDQVTKIMDNLKFVIAELKKWEEIKKEIEEQLIEAKLEIVKAISTCKKLAAQKFKEAKGNLDGLVATIGSMDLATMTSGIKKNILKEFEEVMEDYDWWTSGGEEQVKDLKKAIQKSVTDDLTRILDHAISYVEQSTSWQRVERLVLSIKELQTALDFIFNKAKGEESSGTMLTKQLEDLGKKLIASAGSKAAEVLGDLIKPAGPAFKMVGKFLTAYKIGTDTLKIAQDFPNGLDKFLPKEFNKTFIEKNDIVLFSYGIDIPIASLGWITLTAGVSLSSTAGFKISGQIKLYNTFKPEEVKILDGSITATGSINLVGRVTLGVNLAAIVEAKAIAELSAEGLINDATAQLNILRKLSGDAKKGAIILGGQTTLAFEVKGALKFSVGLTSALRTIVKWFTSKDPVITWDIGEMTLFHAETSKNFSTSIKFDSFEFNFDEIEKLLNSISTYRLSSEGKKNIESSVSGKLGRRDQWEEYSNGAKLTSDELDSLRAQYGKVTV